MWCDQAKWVGTRYYWFKDIVNNTIQFPLYFVVLGITKMAISLIWAVQFWWGFHQNIAVTMLHTMKWKTQFFLIRVQTHFAWSHHILRCNVTQARPQAFYYLIVTWSIRMSRMSDIFLLRYWQKQVSDARYFLCNTALIVFTLSSTKVIYAWF